MQNVEIEKKFLLKDLSCLEGVDGVEYKQAYLNTHPDRTVRVRVMEDKGYLTIKSKTVGIARNEYEYEIPFLEANNLLIICEEGKIEKVRYKIPHGDLMFEIDVFSGDNAGLTIAEIELPSEDTQFEKPEWLGEEVSNDKRYFNSYLSQNPYSKW